MNYIRVKTNVLHDVYFACGRPCTACYRHHPESRPRAFARRNAYSCGYIAILPACIALAIYASGVILIIDFTRDNRKIAVLYINKLLSGIAFCTWINLLFVVYTARSPVLNSPVGRERCTVKLIMPHQMVAGRSP